jgi:hypothetical protein
MVVTLFVKAMQIACNPNLSMPPRVQLGLLTGSLVDETSVIRHAKSGQFRYWRKIQDFGLSRTNFVAIGTVLAVTCFLKASLTKRRTAAERVPGEKQTNLPEDVVGG